MTDERSVVLICKGTKRKPHPHAPSVLAELVVRDSQVVDLRQAGLENVRQALMARGRTVALPFDRRCRQCNNNPQIKPDRLLWFVTTILDGAPERRRVEVDVGSRVATVVLALGTHAAE